jgi:hypothetical protein
MEQCVSEPVLFQTPLEAPDEWYDLTKDEPAFSIDDDFFEREHPLHEHPNGPPKLKSLLEVDAAAAKATDEGPSTVIAPFAPETYQPTPNLPPTPTPPPPPPRRRPRTRTRARASS